MAIDYVYSDFDSRLRIKNSGEPLIIYDQDAIVQSIKSILSTVSGERVRNPIGSSLVGLLFEPMSIDSALDIQEAIQFDISRKEPRIDSLRVSVQANFDGNFYDVTVRARVSNIQRPIDVSTRLRAMGQ